MLRARLFPFDALSGCDQTRFQLLADERVSTECRITYRLHQPSCVRRIEEAQVCGAPSFRYGRKRLVLDVRREELILRAARVAGVARPAIRLWRRDHSSLHGIQLDVPVAPQYVAGRINEA